LGFRAFTSLKWQKGKREMQSVFTLVTEIYHEPDLRLTNRQRDSIVFQQVDKTSDRMDLRFWVAASSNVVGIVCVYLF
jgi:hypothetical protein